MKARKGHGKAVALYDLLEKQGNLDNNSKIREPSFHATRLGFASGVDDKKIRHFF
jgi:hypothetical protein